MTDEGQPKPLLPAKIVLGTDLSARCDRALDRAAALAEAWNAELIVVHAMEQAAEFYDDELSHRIPSWRKSDPALLVARRLRQDLADRAATPVLEPGEASAAILRAAEERGAGLIVTGIARDEMLGRFGLGNTVDRLVRRSPLPVLIVKDRPQQPYRQILVATDFSDTSLEALRLTQALFPDARINLLNVFDTPMEGWTSDPAAYREEARRVALGELEAFALKAAVPIATDRQRTALFAEPGNPGDVIRQFAEDFGVDLVVLGTKGRNALLEMLIGSTARAVLSILPCDALVVPGPHARKEEPAEAAA